MSELIPAGRPCKSDVTLIAIGRFGFTAEFAARVVTNVLEACGVWVIAARRLVEVTPELVTLGLHPCRDPADMLRIVST